jgi:hypothetical protein
VINAALIVHHAQVLLRVRHALQAIIDTSLTQLALVHVRLTTTMSRPTIKITQLMTYVTLASVPLIV